MSELNKMHKSDLYNPGAPEIVVEQEKYSNQLYEFNRLEPSDKIKRKKLLENILGGIGTNSYIETPFPY